MNERPILSVSELNDYIRELLDGDGLLRSVSVRGELSNYKIYPSGHHYFTLKDSGSSLRCVMFKSSAVKLRFRPENGMAVVVSGRVAVYPRDGAYQLYAAAIMPEGAGDLQVAFEQLKAKLAAEGLFDEAHKKPLPRFPKRIAIITSPAGAAVHDMIRILRARWPLCEVCLLPVRVQGAEAPPEIAGALRYANEFQVADLIITGRGGGSIEDLWAFNDERVARAIYASGIPVISAVGHEPDVTIADFVADRRASTPSNAAEIAVPDRQEIEELLRSYEIRSGQALSKQLARYRERLESLRQKRVLTDPTASIDNRRIALDYLRDRLCAAQERLLSDKRRDHVRLAASLDAMSPLKVLARGYAVAEGEDGKAVRRAAVLREGEHLRLRFADGRAACRVETIELQGETP